MTPLNLLRSNLRRLAIGAALLGALLLSISCIEPDAVVTPPTPAPAQIASSTENCDQMMGEVFADPGQRNWFLDHCSSWPPDQVAQSPVSTENPQCVTLRIKQNPTPQDRAWYAANCSGDGAPLNAATSNAPAAPGDRTSCDQIRGTPYRSPSERQWYFANCLGNNNNSPAGANQSPNAGLAANRANCAQIRGTPYLSDVERQWFLANCFNQAPPPNQPPPNPPANNPPVNTNPPPNNGNGNGNKGNGHGNGNNRNTGWPYINN